MNLRIRRDGHCYDSRRGETSASQSEVLIDKRDRILIITINRPEAKNAANAGGEPRPRGGDGSADDDPALSVGILTGAGGTFSCGHGSEGVRAGEKTSRSRAAAWASPSGRRSSRSSPRWKATRWPVEPSWRWPPI